MTLIEFEWKLLVFYSQKMSQKRKKRKTFSFPRPEVQRPTNTCSILSRCLSSSTLSSISCYFCSIPMHSSSIPFSNVSCLLSSLSCTECPPLNFGKKSLDCQMNVVESPSSYCEGKLLWRGVGSGLWGSIPPFCHLGVLFSIDRQKG